MTSPKNNFYKQLSSKERQMKHELSVNRQKEERKTQKQRASVRLSQEEKANDPKYPTAYLWYLAFLDSLVRGNSCGSVQLTAEIDGESHESAQPALPS